MVQNANENKFRVPYTFFVKRDWGYLFFRETWFKFFFSGFMIRNFKIFLYVQVNPDFGLLCVTHEGRVEFVVIGELSRFA